MERLTLYGGATPAPFQGLRLYRLPSMESPSLRVAFIGPASGNALRLARALERLGHTVSIIDPASPLGASKWVARWLFHTGGFGVDWIIGRWLLQQTLATTPNLVFIAQGEFLGPSTLRSLRRLNVPIINYTVDNPFSGRDGLRFRYYRKAIRYYDLVAVAFEENIDHLRLAGQNRAMRIWLAADEKAHRPRFLDEAQRRRYCAEVSFIGTWMPERGPFMRELVDRGVPLSIWGDRWQKAPEWDVIAPYWRGPGIYDDDGYAAAIQSSRICLGLLSKGNRNLHSNRTFEIPALGGLLCAERTSEHLALYDEGREAVFWRDAEECAAWCHRLLSDEPLRREIARRGHERAIRNNCFNEPMLASVLQSLNSGC